jgi:hypothetical protein
LDHFLFLEQADYHDPEIMGQILERYEDHHNQERTLPTLMN